MNILALDPATWPIDFTVPTVPVAQPRPKAASHAGVAHVYGAATGHAIHAFKATCVLAASGAYSGAQLEGPLSVVLEFVMPRPKMPKKSNPGRINRTVKPDCDNLAKSVLDALSGRLFVDDKQVTCLVVSKQAAAVDELPHVRVRIRELFSFEAPVAAALASEGLAERSPPCT